MKIPVRFALLAAATLATACAESQPPIETANVDRPPETAALWPEVQEAWGTYHSPRFEITIQLPEPRQWVVDDKSKNALVAVEPSTKSTLLVLSEFEGGLQNHRKCEKRGIELGFVTEEQLQSMRLLEDTVIVGPRAYDTRVRVAIDAPDGPNRPITGHVIAFGAYVRKCLLFHLKTVVPSEAAEPVLSERLALARARILGAIHFDEIGAVQLESR